MQTLGYKVGERRGNNADINTGKKRDKVAAEKESINKMPPFKNCRDSICDLQLSKNIWKFYVNATQIHIDICCCHIFFGSQKGRHSNVVNDNHDENIRVE